MNSGIKCFQNLFNSHQIKMKDEFLDKIYQKFKIYFISKFEDTAEINDIKNRTKIIIIDTMEYFNEEFLIICFEETIILVSKTTISLLEHFFRKHDDSKIIIAFDKIEEILPEYVQIDKEESNKMKKISIKLKETKISDFSIIL